MAKRETQATPTRKQILISRREREQLRLIYMSLGLVAALIIVVLAIGTIRSYVIEPNSPIATVKGEEIITRDYDKRVHYERFLLDQQYFQLLAQRANAAQSEDDQLSQFLLGQYDQLLNQLLQQRSVIDHEVVDMMINEKLGRDATAERGISASEEDLNEFINRFLATQQGGLTVAAAAETATARLEASATATLWTPTPTGVATPSPTLTTTESITPTATPADTPTPAPTPTLNVLSEDALNTEYATWLETLAEGAGVNEAEYRSIVKNLVLTDKLQQAIGSEVPTSAEQSQARHILVETEEEANDVIKRLAAGEDFADLAMELSTDTSTADKGGDLGFVPKGSFVTAVDEAVFSLPIGEISEPVESDFGWHIIEVLEREERELGPAEYERSQRLAYDEWLKEARVAAEIEDFWTPDKAPADPNNPLFQTQPASLPTVPEGQ